MGALTLKSFPFELRGWDIEKFESIDPTDSFGSNTRVYVSKDQIVQIEPDYNVNTFNTWLTDKGRQFFDGVFNKWSEKKINNQGDNSWSKIFLTIIKTVYIFDHCNLQLGKKKFFTIVFENISLEILSILLILSQNYNFLKIRRAENFNFNNDLESNLQLNNSTQKLKLNSSTLCLLISNNPRYEGYYLNLNLRQRFLKGNFKCLNIGSLIDLTFPSFSLGSNLNVIKSITEGNNLICQNIKSSKNPIIIFNNELLKRRDGENTVEMLKMLEHSSNINKTWNGVNMLNSSLHETGINTLAKIPPLSLTDLNNFSSIYFLNSTINNLSNFKKITELKLLNYSFLNSKNIDSKLLILNQSSAIENKNKLEKVFPLNINHFAISSSNFYENEETFINTEGLIKRTTKLIDFKKNKSNWKILRRLLKSIKQTSNNFNQKNKSMISFNCLKISSFRNFQNFHYLATQSITNLSFYLTIRNKPIKLLKSNNFKYKTKKINITRIKHWMDDFFSGGKDEYSQNSLILNNCSKILRSESTNFF